MLLPSSSSSFLASLALLLTSSPSTVNAAPHLTMQSYEQTLSSKNTLVKFYQPWCGHCKAMAPDYDRLSELYPTESSTVAVVEVNCEEEEEICEANNIQGYPTLKYFVDSKEHAYEGGRDYDSMHRFVEETLVKTCDLEDADSTCSDKALTYHGKWGFKSNAELDAELKRLEGLSSGIMKAELRAWIMERKSILAQVRGEL
jgi:protein disulfide-isomerase A6